jgi:hypothetical protein
MRYTAPVLLAFFGSLAGCGDAEQLIRPELGAANVLVDECSKTRSLQPRYWSRQGQLLEGLVGPSFTVQGARLGCQEISGTNVQGSQLVGSLDGRALSPAEFVGAALLIRDSNGRASEIAVTRVETDSEDGTGETWLYTLAALDASGESVHNLCQPDAAGRSVAVALKGRWDATGQVVQDGSISFHCTSGAIAKCVRWGYRPWQSFAGKPLAEHHQACTRMARADYCGDGETHTREGTGIDFYDSLGLRISEPSLGLGFEATWSTQGAWCIARERWLSLESLLTAECKGQFFLTLQPSPIKPLDLCFAQRIGATAQQALLSNRTNLNLGL